MQSDEELARAFAGGSVTAFEALVYRYHRPLLAYVQRLLGREQPAEDLVQETFFRFVRQVREGRVPDRIRPWLYRVAGNLCRDYWKAAERRCDRGLPEGWGERHGERPTVADIYERLETRQQIRSALDELPDVQRRMVVLRFYHDFTYQEIADVLEMPVGTVKAYLFKALRRLRDTLENSESSSRTGGDWVARWQA
ncbi:MAG: sigma-70 family RNA polymerase sigma factor [Kyrpidia sp.]|nr:sigma-70 family RNA polymerase sigma factor [Kyrpidia sp.]